MPTPKETEVSLKLLGAWTSQHLQTRGVRIWLQLPLVLIWFSALPKNVASATCLAEPKPP